MDNTSGSEKNYEFEECFVAFLDVLGIKKLLNTIEQKPGLLKKIIEAIKNNSRFVEKTKKETTGEGKLDFRGFYFSDNFAFAMKKKKKKLPHLLLVIRYLQDRFWERGFLIRGAITVGKMYFPEKGEKVLLGQGLVDAYKLESEIAIYPRIIVSQKLFEYIEKEDIKAYPFGKRGKLKELIRQDKDGIFFLDLLNSGVLRKKNETINEMNNNSFSIEWDSEDESNYSGLLQKVESLIERNLDEYKDDIKIRQKYKWFESYIKESKNDIADG